MTKIRVLSLRAYSEKVYFMQSNITPSSIVLLLARCMWWRYEADNIGNIMIECNALWSHSRIEIFLFRCQILLLMISEH
jgi:hypothetical protein